MARLPQPGSDEGNWGDILNDYLSQEHDADGTHISANIKFKVDSIADLKNFDRKVKIEAVSVLGYYSPSDGGGGDFYWDAGSIDADDSGMTIESSVDATGRWKRVNNTGSVNVRWFGATGNGGDNDQPAIQAAIDYANSFVGAGVSTSSGINVYFPEGKYYITSTLEISSDFDGLGLSGPISKGAIITTDKNIVMLMVGEDLSGGIDTVDANSTYFTHIFNLMFINTDLTNSAVAIQMNRSPNSKISDCSFWDFYISIDGYRFNQSAIYNCTFYNNHRRESNTALAFIRLQGVYDSSNSHTTGGGCHITDCEFIGKDGNLAVENAILVNCVDGLYITQCHVVMCKNAITLKPLNTLQNNKITDVMVENCYFDGPRGEARNVSIEGVVSYGGAAGNGLYQNIKFVGCLFRGAMQANYGVVISVGDGGGFASNKELKNISFIGCTFKQHKINSIAANGEDLGKLEVQGIIINGCFFEDNNESNTASTGMGIDARSVVITNNIFDADLNPTDRCINIILSNPDLNSTSLTIANNDFSRSNCTDIVPYKYTNIKNAKINISKNIMPVSNINIKDTYSVNTSGYDPTIIWRYSLISKNFLGTLNVNGIGQSTDTNNQYVAMELMAVFRADNNSSVSRIDYNLIHQTDSFSNNQLPITTVLLTGDIWTSNMTVLVGDVIVNAGNAYLIITSDGNAGTTPPTHTSGSKIIGGIRYLYLDAEDVNTVVVVVSGETGYSIRWAVNIDFMGTP